MSGSDQEHIDSQLLPPLPPTPTKEKMAFVAIPQIKPRKRQNTCLDLDSPPIKKTMPRLSFYQHEADKMIADARNLLLKAATTLADDKKRQDKVLDLLEVFRTYTEEDKVEKATKRLVLNMEQATRKLVNTSKTTYASIASKRGETGPKKPNQDKSQETIQANPVVNPIKEKSEWTTIQRSKQPRKPVRLVLDPKDKKITFNSKSTRDNINKALHQQGYPRACISSVSKSMKNNIILTFLEEGAKAFTLKHQDIIQRSLPFVSILEDESWHKVVLHGVSTEEFNTPTGLDDIQKEIESFNKGFKIAGKPIWLTSQERRSQQAGASVLVAFHTEEEANRAIQQRLYIGAVSVRVEKAKDKPKQKALSTSN